eukprot:m.287647 g.287647  ORF g.287647 m.287647 type:complete len:319 (+) comp40703_c0_seq48:1423-2379(+)
MKRVKIDMNQSDLSTGQFVITASAGEFISTTEDCPCGFFKAMMLPCKHILAVRDILKCPLFSETLCATRWLLQHYIQNHAFIESSGSNTLDITVDSDFPSVEAATLSEQEKYRKAFKVAQETATDLSLLGTADFNVYYKQLKSVRDLIRKRHPFLVIPAEKNPGKPHISSIPAAKRKKSSKPVKFILKSRTEKEKAILQWFVDDKIADRAMREDQLIEEELVEVRPEKIPMKCLSPQVSIHQVKIYFTIDGWKAVTNVCDVLRERGEWSCDACQKDFSEGETSVGCDGCLSWYHLGCIGRIEAPKKNPWFCRGCYRRI